MAHPLFDTFQTLAIMLQEANVPAERVHIGFNFDREQDRDRFNAWLTHTLDPYGVARMPEGIKTQNTCMGIRFDLNASKT